MLCIKCILLVLLCFQFIVENGELRKTKQPDKRIRRQKTPKAVERRKVNKYSTKKTTPMKPKTRPVKNSTWVLINGTLTNMTSKAKSVKKYPDKRITLDEPYPSVRQDESVKDEYHGLEVPDPYRWLENPYSPETEKFVMQQNNLTYPYLRNCTLRDTIRNQLLQMANFEKYSSPQRQGNHYFYYYNTGLQNHSALYIQRNLKDTPEVFLDPNNMSTDGSVALKGFSFSENAEFFAYIVSKSGSDWNTMHIREVETNKTYPEVITGIKFPSIVWTHDNKGFFYNRYYNVTGKTDGTETTAHMGQKLYYHLLGTNQDTDTPVVEFSQKSLGIYAEITECGRYLLVYTSNNTQGVDIHYFDLLSLPNGKISGLFPLKRLISDMQHQHDYITNIGSRLLMKTSKGAPRGKVVIIDLNNSSEKHWKVLIPENKTKTLTMVAAVAKDKLVTHYIENVKSVLQIHDMHTGKHLSTFKLDIGQVTCLSGRQKYNDIFFGFTSFLIPGIVYHYNISGKEKDSSKKIEPTVFRETIIPDFDPTRYKTKQVYYRSDNETKVPMYIMERYSPSRTVRNRDKPVIIYGYGGYGVSLLPTFTIGRIIFIRYFNGIYAIPNIRGGGELGEEWHEAGRLLNKQNSFNDFEAAAEFFIRNKYTKPEYITIIGGSNGGLLVGACINQRPELYGAAIIIAGALDMLRFNLFTIAYFSESEFGSPRDKAQFYNLLAYSPLHNIRPSLKNNTQYPATLVITGDHDDRVPPLHSYKFIAELQSRIGSLSYQKRPLLLRVEHNVGHGQGTPLMSSIDELTDIYVFLLKSLGLKYYKSMPW